MTDRSGRPRGNTWLGDYGERVAATWLKAQRHRILARNFRGRRGGEVDIIARDANQLLFIEVKTRHKDSRIRPLDAVNKSKQALITHGADVWLAQLGKPRPRFRFDVIEVLVEDGARPSVRHIRNAF